MLSSTEIRDLITGGMVEQEDPPFQSMNPKLRACLDSEWDKQLDCEGGAFDLTIDQLFDLTQETMPIIGPDQRVEPRIRPIPWDCTEEIPLVRLMPGDYVLFRTREIFNIPDNVGVTLHHKSTTHRDGLNVIFAVMHPGYCGSLTLGLHVVGPLPVAIKYGARMLTSRYEWIDAAGTKQYDGPHQGGVVTTSGQAIGPC